MNIKILKNYNNKKQKGGSARGGEGGRTLRRSPG